MMLPEGFSLCFEQTEKVNLTTQKIWSLFFTLEIDLSTFLLLGYILIECTDHILSISVYLAIIIVPGIK